MTAFASGKHALALCDRCARRYPLHELREEVVNLHLTGKRVCPECRDGDHPQLQVGRLNMDDPQALRNARPENYTSSRSIQWGWMPVGGGTGELTPNTLIAQGAVGDVTVTVA